MAFSNPWLPLDLCSKAGMKNPSGLPVPAGEFSNLEMKSLVPSLRHKGLRHKTSGAGQRAKTALAHTLGTLISTVLPSGLVLRVKNTIPSCRHKAM